MGTRTRTVKEMLVADAEKYLVPELKKIVPVLTGRLKRSIGVEDYRGKFKEDADKNSTITNRRSLRGLGGAGFKLVQRVDLYLIRGAVVPAAQIVVGSVLGPREPRETWPALYGHVRYSLDRHFAIRWDNVTRRYANTFADRIAKEIAIEIPFLAA